MSRAAVIFVAFASGCSLFADVPDLSSGLAVGPASPLPDASAPSDGAVASNRARAYADAVIKSAPFTYYRFGEKSGGVARDEMNRHAGTYLLGAELGAEGALPGNSAVRVHTTGLGVAGPPASAEIHERAPFSVELWVNPRAIGTVNHTVFIKAGFVGGKWQEFGAYVTKDEGFVFERYVDEAQYKASSPVAVGRFTYVAMVYDGRELALYLDGRLAKTASDTRSQPAKEGNWNFGSNPSPGSDSIFDGVLDEVALYDRALTATEISAHYEAAGGN